MNRHDRRKAAKVKRSRDARPEEIFPDDTPGRGHGPVQNKLVEVMTGTLDVLREALPGYEITLFIAESHAQAGPDRLPRFNYMSTADRADMLAVLEAFVAKNRRDGSILDQINNPPASEVQQ